MTKALTIITVVAALLLTIPLGKKVVDTVRAGGITQEEQTTAKRVQMPQTKDLLTAPAPEKENTSSANLVLEAKNTVTFRGPVMGSTVAKAIKEISALSRNLSKTDVIYLVLDTPGGSILDGADFIDFLAGLPQEVRTVTLFAASMGFHIVESNPGKRLIARGGILMSHRAKGGLEGQFDGEMETEYRFFKRKIDYLEVVASTRIGLNLEQYKAKIKDEYWIHGFDAQAEKVADQMVLLRCGESMTGEDAITLQTMFGPVTVVFDKCPLIKDPIRIDFAGIRLDAQPYVKAMINEVLYDKKKFVKEVLIKGKFNEIFQ